MILKNNTFYFGLLFLCIIYIKAENVYKVCSGDGTKEICTQMSRGNSEVNCIWVQDSIECAKRILNKTADFGMFSAESMLQLAVLDWPELSVIQSFAQKDRQNDLADFESVVIVRKDHHSGLNGLRGKKYCHPGVDYNPNEKWSERFLKHFERKVVTPKCEKNKSPAEIEAAALSQFFGESCRAGIWSYDQTEDKELKEKYSSLCKLCPKSNCKYTDIPVINKNHEFALQCLKDYGDVAYVSLEESKIYFNKTTDIKSEDYHYLCIDGSTVPITNNPRPCTWLRQPWKAVIARYEIRNKIQEKLKQWMQNSFDGVSWQSALKKILNIDGFQATNESNIENPKDHMSRYRPIPRDETFCNTVISWCTVSQLEQEKCNVVKAGGISTGIFPQIRCRSPVDTPIQCLHDIRRNDTDFMGLDSNYGWLARSKYNSTAALYFDTEIDQFSSIVIVVKENSRIKSFTDLQGENGCLPEYDSSTAVSLINELKNKQIFDQDSCNYGLMLKNFLGDSCLPGAQDWKYSETKNASLTSLCNLCYQGGHSYNSKGNLNVSINTQDTISGNSTSYQPNWKKALISNCEADESNRYFGNRGALKCLNEVGTFAVLELQSLKVHSEEVEIDDNRFRILCKNNTLAKETGFDVDLNCALTTIVDGEIITHRKSPKSSSVVHVLQALEHFFIRKNDPSFKIYNIFEGQRNILFKDSTIGLTSPESPNQSLMVDNYKKLFIDIEKCSGAITVFKVCSGDGTKEICTQMSRGKTEVNCIWVQDSIECAKRIVNRTADFGMFSAESMLQLAVLDWPELSVVQPFAHKEREYATVDFESVVIVRKDHENGLEGLKGKKYCHPGFDYNPDQKWSERFFKHFERTIISPKCEKDKSPAELEAATLSQFFGESCRPGIWSYDQNEDKELKKKYSSLCKLCPNRAECKYSKDSTIEKNHEFALKCLKDGGDVAYVSLQDAQLFFNTTADVNVVDYHYLCPDGNKVPIANNLNPCVWLRQPWKAVISRSDIDNDVKKKLNQWMQKSLEGVSWESALRNILKLNDFRQISNTVIASPKDYMSKYRPIPIDETYCNTVVSWCTVSSLEQEKCKIAKAGGISTGIYPHIECRAPVGRPVQCLEDINRNDTDFMGIDSNYGWLARSNYNLTAALYFDTEIEQFSSIVIAVKDFSTIKNYENLRDKKACFPEYGSSAAIALINEYKDRKIFKKDDCNYGAMLKSFFGNSCLPGALDWKYVRTNNGTSTTLCNLCFESSINIDINESIGEQPIKTCSADKTNKYFGNRGALKCLDEVGDIAILELQSLKVHAEEVKVDEHRFRILCKNNTLAKETGFDVDLNCPLTTIVDGEIVMYRKSAKTSSVVHVLKALEHYFIRKSDPSFKIYNIFEGTRNLLFKDSTVGLTHPDSSNQGIMVENYKKLFNDVEKCAGNSAATISIHMLSTFFILFFTYILSN